MKIFKYLLLSLCLISILLLVTYVSDVQKKEAKLQESLVEMHMEVKEYEKLADEIDENNLVMETGFHGFEKKGRQYLIDSAEDIYKLAELVNNGQYIEDGVLAGEASYRFLNDITLPHNLKTEFSGIGTQEHSFNGIIDGDGHTLYGNFLADYEDEIRYFYAYGDGVIVNLNVNNLFKQQYDSRMPLFYKLLEAPFTVDMRSRHGSLYATIENQAECDGLVEFLNSNEQIWYLYVTVAASSIDTAQLSNCIYEGQSLYAQVDFQAKEQQTDERILAEGFLSRIDTMEVSEDVKTVMKGEQLLSFRKQIVLGLSCYSYLFDGLWSDGEYNPLPILILAEGAWGNKENICQLVTVPAPEHMSQDLYSIEAADVNFDGLLDLMIKTGKSSGTGGNWLHYRSAVWNPETETFLHFPSMPEQITDFDQSGKRIIQVSHSGAGEETISVYEVIDGEYIETRRLVYVTWNEPFKLYYYEYGELVEEIIVHEDYEVIQRFPDLDFWRKG